MVASSRLQNSCILRSGLKQLPEPTLDVAEESLCFFPTNQPLPSLFHFNLCFVPCRRAWWRTNVRIPVRKPSRSFTSSSPALVRRATASTRRGSPTCQRRSSSLDTGRPESLREAPSASDYSGVLPFETCCEFNAAALLTVSLHFPCRKLCQFAEDAAPDNARFTSLVELLNTL